MALTGVQRSMPWPVRLYLQLTTAEPQKDNVPDAAPVIAPLVSTCGSQQQVPLLRVSKEAGTKAVPAPPFAPFPPPVTPGDPRRLPPARSRVAGGTAGGLTLWRPHSFMVASSHHQRPSRSCCPGRTDRVHGSHPMDTNPCAQPPSSGRRRVRTGPTPQATPG